MAFDWASVLVPPTGSTGLDTGDHTAVDENPPWSDADEAVETITSSSTEVAIFSGFNLSNAPGENESYAIWARMRTTGSFLDTITLKQDTTTLWVSDPISVTNTAFRTFFIPIPNGLIAERDNLSLEWSCQNQGSNATMRWSWMRMSKSPFTNAQKAVLPTSLSGQDFTCYRESDLAVLGAVDGEALILLPDASGNGRHAILRAGSATYQTDAPAGILPGTGRFVGTLGYDPAADAIIEWTGNKILHANVYPTSTATVQAILSAANSADFIGVINPPTAGAQKHLMSYEDTDEWTMMSGDGSAGAHLHGGTVLTDVEQRVTEWIQVGGNEHMWIDDEVLPIIDGVSGENPLYAWSLLDRESDDRPFTGRLREMWIIEGTGVTEAEIDAARSEWVTGIPGGDPDMGEGQDENRMGGTGAIRRARGH